MGAAVLDGTSATFRRSTATSVRSWWNCAIPRQTRGSRRSSSNVWTWCCRTCGRDRWKNSGSTARALRAASRNSCTATSARSAPADRYKDRPGYDPLMQAFGGIMSVTGEEGRPPVRVGPSIVDMGTGYVGGDRHHLGADRRARGAAGRRRRTSLTKHRGLDDDVSRGRVPGLGESAAAATARAGPASSLPRVTARRRRPGRRGRQQLAVPQARASARPSRMGAGPALPRQSRNGVAKPCELTG